MCCIWTVFELWCIWTVFVLCCVSLYLDFAGRGNLKSELREIICAPPPRLWQLEICSTFTFKIIFPSFFFQQCFSLKIYVSLSPNEHLLWLDLPFKSVCVEVCLSTRHTSQVLAIQHLDSNLPWNCILVKLQIEFVPNLIKFEFGFWCLDFNLRQ